jgi:hypothetical protein
MLGGSRMPTPPRIGTCIGWRSGDAPPPESLPARMIAFAFVHAQHLQQLASERGSTIEDLLEACSRGAGGLWRALDTAPLAAAKT